MTFAAFAALGYGSRLIPIIPPGAPISERSNLFKRIQAGEDGRGKIPGVRWPDGRWSGFDWRAHATIETDLPRWDSMGAGVGIRLDDGLVAIDADTLHEDRALAIKATIEKWIGCAPARIGRWPKVLYLVRTTAPYRYARVEFGHANGHPRERVEILSSGRQFVAEGIHPVTREAYRWPAGLPSVESLPVVAPATLDGLMHELRQVLPEAGVVAREGVGELGVEIDQARLRGDVSVVRAAVEALPNTTALFPTREAYLGVGYRIKASLPDDPDTAFALWEGWCARWRDPDGRANDPDVARGDWARMKGPFRRGAESLYRLAQELSGGSFNAAATAFHEPVEDEPAPLFPPGNEGREGNDGAAAALQVVNAATLADQPIPAQEWLVKDMIPANNVTLLGGDGGTGKSLLALQLAIAKASGSDWLGIPLEAGRALFLSAEDEIEELHRRTKTIRPDMWSLEQLDFVPLAGKDAVLAAPIGRDGLLRETRLFAALDAAIARTKPALVVLDTLADLFGGDEIKKIHARSFVGMLRGLALRHSTTILLLYHPSLSGMSSGSGTSGNVAWGNSVRSRIYLERLKDSEGRDIDSNKRKLEVKKANRAASGVVIPLRYAAGRFVREGDAIAASDVAETAEKAFLALLDQFEAEQRPVSHQVVCRNYAPRMFAEHHRSGGLTKADFKRAMDRLFEQTVIRIAPYGRAGRQFEKIVKTDTKSELQPRIENNDLLG